MDHGTDDTSSAAANDGDETTVLPDTSETIAAQLAWSVDYGDEETDLGGQGDDDGRIRQFLRRIGPAVAILLPVAAIIVLLVMLFNANHPQQQAFPPGATRPAQPPAKATPAPAPAAPSANPAPAPPPVIPSPAPAALPTPTPVQAAPTYAPPPPQEPGPDADQRFLALASQIPGITITDPAAGATSARAVCRGLQNGRTPADEAVATANNTGLTPEHAAALVTSAISVYCPQYLG